MCTMTIHTPAPTHMNVHLHMHPSTHIAHIHTYTTYTTYTAHQKQEEGFLLDHNG